MPTDFRTCSTGACRDHLAECLGWRLIADDGNLQRTCWINERYNGCPASGRTIIVTKQGEDTHPIALSMDAAHAAMPEGCRFERYYCRTMHRWEWSAWRMNDHWKMVLESDGFPVTLTDSGNPAHDLIRLACLAWEAVRG